MIESTLEDRDLKVLAAAVAICNESGGAACAADIGGRTGLDDQEVQASLAALVSEHPPFFATVEGRFAGGVSHVFAPTGHARRAAGQWPNPEDKLNELIRVLELAAEQEPDEEKSRFWKKAAAQAGGISRDLFVNVISGVITGSS